MAKERRKKKKERKTLQIQKSESNNSPPNPSSLFPKEMKPGDVTLMTALRIQEDTDHSTLKPVSSNQQIKSVNTEPTWTIQSQRKPKTSGLNQQESESKTPAPKTQPFTRTKQVTTKF
ncbi:hypothetical protein ABEB36_009486 [Hypothenemus hampei]|uniref:Uncharacterized protein n=1 Tax=Hypothenemus hampei TaxID=57062 RepID=A0ABD1EGH4_HYPHA